MKTIYPTPIQKNTMLDMIHTLQSRLAHRTHGSFRWSRAMRCRTKLLVTRVLNQLERVFS